MRLFLAIELPEAVRTHLEAVQQLLRPHARSVSWTRAQNLHLTLKFLGEVPDPDLPHVTAALERVPVASPIALQSEGLEIFPPRGPIRILAAALKGDVPRLAALVEGLEEALAPLGFARETRRFTPHLTLGRVRSTPEVPRRRPKGPRETPPIAYALDRMRGHAFGEDSIDLVELVRSRLSPGGSVYESLAAFELLKDRPDANGLQ